MHVYVLGDGGGVKVIIPSGSESGDDASSKSRTSLGGNGKLNDGPLCGKRSSSAKKFIIG